MNGRGGYLLSRRSRGWLSALVLLLACGTDASPPGQPVTVARGEDARTGVDAPAADGAASDGGSTEGQGGDPCERRACNAGVPDLCCPAACSAATDIDCAGCGNRRLEAGELCDPADSCPTSCPQLACEKQRLKSEGTCAAVCVSAGLQESCLDGDECCPPGCTAANDRDCGARCGNATLEPGELCDPPASCPQSCPRQGCTILGLTDAGTCLARCVEMGQESACRNDDGCCPAGCNAGTDNDCSIVCGNGAIEGRETCDPVASCPARCPAQGCRLRRLLNAGTCTAACVDEGLETRCQAGDGCCPVGCHSLVDSDCPVLCGNGQVEMGESCDPIARCREQEQACVSDRSTVRMRTGDSGSCRFRCVETARSCGVADGACPPGCGPTQDSDCPGCGNAIREPGETCDPCNPADVEACTGDANFVRTPGGSVAACTFACTVTPRACLTGDGFCPGMCNRANDRDCLAAPGDPCKVSSECAQGSCVDDRCCVESCAVCQSCTAPRGTCASITKGLPDLVPPNACANGSICDGTGRCLPPACTLMVRPAAVSFPPTALGASAAAETITVLNPCNTDLPQPTVASSSPEFPVAGNRCLGVLPAGRACAVVVGFRPEAIGARAGTLQVGIPGATASTVELTGTGQRPIILLRE